MNFTILLKNGHTIHCSDYIVKGNGIQFKMTPNQPFEYINSDNVNRVYSETIEERALWFEFYKWNQKLLFSRVGEHGNLIVDIREILCANISMRDQIKQLTKIRIENPLS